MVAQLLKRRRGNPNWGRPIAPITGHATEFEVQVKHLRLTPETYASSTTLRAWCLQNKDRVYIPEWLLKEWGIEVDATTRDAA